MTLERYISILWIYMRLMVSFEKSSFFQRDNITVKLIHYCSHDGFGTFLSRMSWYATWGNITFTKDDKADYYVIYQSPYYLENFDPRNTIVIQTEPWCKYSEYKKFQILQQHRDCFLYFHDIPHDRNTVGWMISPTYNQLKNNEIVFSKNKILSSVTSHESSFEGQKKRFVFLKELYQSLPIDVYWRWLSVSDFPAHCPGTLFWELKWHKDPGLFPYRYTFAAENCSEKNYFTEKICDAILSECLCFYWWCPNINDFFDPRSFIQIDLDNFSKSLQIIQESIQNNEWEKRLPYIKQMKSRILDEYQIMPTIENIFISKGILSRK